MRRNPINIVIAIDSPIVPAWQFCLVEQLLASDLLSLRKILYCGTPAESANHPSNGLVFNLITRFERSRQSFEYPACEEKDLRELCSANRKLHQFFQPGQLPESELLADRISAENPDLVLDLSESSSQRNLSDTARLGVWFFEHSVRKAELTDYQTIGLWEVLTGGPVVSSRLVVRLPGCATHKVAYESFSSVRRDSFLQTRDEHLWKLPFFLPRVVRRMSLVGANKFTATNLCREGQEIIREPSVMFNVSGPLALLALLNYAMWWLTRKIRRKFQVQRWALLFHQAARSREWKEFRALVPPEGRFWTDPFVVSRNDRNIIFFEDASLRTWKGHLSAVELRKDGTVSSTRVILKKPYHLSYPFIFEWGNDLYLVPESGENGTIELYRCRSFPHEWEFEHNLMTDVYAYDSTIYEHDGVWWMFTNIKQHAGASSWDELCLFYSDSPIATNWKPHPLNPVVSDVRYARPAGKIFVDQGKIIRPSQDSSYRYGYGLNFMEVTLLTTTSYREHRVEAVKPDWARNIHGIHTYTSDGGVTIVDAICRSFSRRHRERQRSVQNGPEQ